MDKTAGILKILLDMERKDLWLFHITFDVIKSIYQNLGNKGVNGELFS